MQPLQMREIPNLFRSLSRGQVQPTVRNPSKDRSLSGKARVRARKAANRAVRGE